MASISLIIATRNAARFLPEALASVAPSLKDEAVVEILVADGGSSDATLEIAAADHRVQVVSNADTGIYDGMNRALASAKGEYVLFLNSDDILLPGAVVGAIRELDSQPKAGWISAPALFGPAIDGAIVRTFQGPVSVEGALFGIPALNARLFRREFLATLGPIRQEYGLASDREFIARLASSPHRGIPFANPFYLYRVHAGSSTIAGDRAGRKRVYQAEAKLADMLIKDKRIGSELKHFARAAGAIASLKLRMSGTKTVFDWSDLANVTALVRGLWLTWRWRGRLSGY